MTSKLTSIEVETSQGSSVDLADFVVGGNYTLTSGGNYVFDATYEYFTITDDNTYDNDWYEYTTYPQITIGGGSGPYIIPSSEPAGPPRVRCGYCRQLNLLKDDKLHCRYYGGELYEDD